MVSGVCDSDRNPDATQQHSKRSRSKSLVRSRKRRLGKQAPRPSVKYQSKSTLFEEYVATQSFLPYEEHASFLQCLHRPLPMHFRIRSASVLREFEGMLQRGLVKSALPSLPPSSFRLSPQEVDQNYRLRAWLSQQTRCGNLSRQEFVSMLPVHLLQVEPHHALLDLCASPGSKTIQAVDCGLYGDVLTTEKSSSVPSGFCVANEIDSKRAYILAHRCCRELNERGRSLAITCHNAAKFPNVMAPLRSAGRSDRRTTRPYDRIICDVPCSGDGTLRKDFKVWKTWHPSYGMELHPLQLRIAKRGIALLKIGGIMTYSTCSFHPIENEAVVAALLATGCVELLPAAQLLQNDKCSIKYRPGLQYWKVLNDELKEVDPEQGRNKKNGTMWPPPRASEIAKQLSSCVRMVPQDNDTGGFFIAILRKVKEFPSTDKLRKKSTAAVTPKPMHHQLHRLDDSGDNEKDSIVHFSRRPAAPSIKASSHFFSLSRGLAEHLDDQIGSDKLNLVYAGLKEAVGG